MSVEARESRKSNICINELFSLIIVKSENMSVEPRKSRKLKTCVN